MSSLWFRYGSLIISISMFFSRMVYGSKSWAGWQRLRFICISLICDVFLGLSSVRSGDPYCFVEKSGWQGWFGISKSAVFAWFTSWISSGKLHWVLCWRVGLIVSGLHCSLLLVSIPWSPSIFLPHYDSLGSLNALLLIHCNLIWQQYQ